MRLIPFVFSSLTTLSLFVSFALPSQSTDGYSMGEVCTQDAGKRGRLRIREHPSINAPIAGLAPDGATVVFLQGKRYYKPRHDWYPVSVKNIYGNRIEGYAAGKYLC